MIVLVSLRSLKMVWDRRVLEEEEGDCPGEQQRRRCITLCRRMKSLRVVTLGKRGGGRLGATIAVL